MKFGKEFQQILDQSDFPDEWKSSAIEYRRLKKLIKDVVSELSGMGLSPDVLHRLLTAEDEDASGASSPSDQPDRQLGGVRRASADGHLSVISNEGNDEVLEFEFESDDSPPTFGPSSIVNTMARGTGSGRAYNNLIRDPIMDEPANGTHDESFSRSADSHSYSHAGPSSLNARNFRVRLLSDSQPRPELGSSFPAHARSSTAPIPVKPIGVADAMRNVDGDQEDLAGSLGAMSLGRQRTLSADDHPKHRRVVRRSMHEGGVRAQYVFAGDSSRPEPQLRFHLPAALSPSASGSSRSHSPSPSASATSEAYTTDDDHEDDDDDDDLQCLPIPQPTQLESIATSPATIRAAKSPFLVPSIDVTSPSIPPSPTLQRMHMVKSPIYALASGSPEEDGLKDLSLGDSAVDTTSALDDVSAAESPIEISTGTSAPPRGERDIIIPLASDRAFFDLLTAALTSLSGFHASQQEEFRQSVDKLCRAISNSIVPAGSSIQVMPIPPMPSRGPSAGTGTGSSSTSRALAYSTHRPPQDILAHRVVKMHKKDLYAWREIFTLWIEAEIFESSAERTRGERTVEQAEQRLQRFAGEVVKRGLGDRRTFRGKKTREAWDEFLRLNVLLLDLKRFQLANINAARKILKKHDKRTALTASSGFQTFARTTLEAVGANGQVSTWTFYNTSLPHVLLASLTDVLLPILPSLDDYACLICTSIAFKPIRLSCQHLFCVRCLVKMQRAGQAECPLCRSPVVLLANKESLDTQVMGFMRDWFPREVKAKQRENDEEIAEEIRQENGGESDGCVIM